MSFSGYEYGSSMTANAPPKDSLLSDKAFKSFPQFRGPFSVRPSCNPSPESPPSSNRMLGPSLPDPFLLPLGRICGPCSEIGRPCARNVLRRLPYSKEIRRPCWRFALSFFLFLCCVLYCFFPARIATTPLLLERHPQVERTGRRGTWAWALDLLFGGGNASSLKSVLLLSFFPLLPFGASFPLFYVIDTSGERFLPLDLRGCFCARSRGRCTLSGFRQLHALSSSLPLQSQ